MGEITYYVATTVDGYIADRSGDCPPSMFLYEGDHIPDFLNQITNFDYVLMGGKTYEYGFKFGLKPGEPGYKGIKHIVFSRTLDFNSNDDVELVKGNAIEYIRKLKERGDKKIWLCGGGLLAGSLLDNKLLDILKLKINPSIAGDGLSLFGHVKKDISLDLLNVRRYDSGVIEVTYQIKY
jgi:dihydrofolate reductase